MTRPRVFRTLARVLLPIALTVTASPPALAVSGDPSGAGLIGANPSTISVETFSGSASGSYGFLFPPGRAGLQPDFMLAYNSGGATEGLAGRGWDLTVPHIQRSTRDGQPTFTWSDQFSIRWGGRLVDLVMICDPSSGCPEGVREYRAEIEKFMRIRSYSFPPALTYWEVEDGNGRTYQFGKDGGTGVWVQAGDFEWALNRIEDSHGNYLTFDWLISYGILYPKAIRYTGNAAAGLAPSNLVEFFYEGRYDVSDGFVGVKPTAAKDERLYRLRKVRTWAGTQVASNYLFDYSTPSTGTQPINLCSGTTCGITTTTCADGSTASCTNPCDPTTGFCGGTCTPVCNLCLNKDCGVTTRTCSDGSFRSCQNSCDPATGNCIPCTPPGCGGPGGGCLSTVPTKPGQTDLRPIPCLRTVPRGHRPVETDLTAWSDDLATSAAQPIASAAFAVQDGPSLLTRITRYDGAGQAALPATTFTYLTDTVKDWAAPIADVPFHFLTRFCNDGYDFDSQGAEIADINRDGLPDLLRGRGTTCGGGGSLREVYINSGGRWTRDTSYTLPADFLGHKCGENDYDNGLRVVDINGDGLEDLVRSVLTNSQPLNCTWDLPQVTVWINNGHGWTQAPAGEWYVPAAFTLVDPFCQDNGRDLGVRLGDVDGDGRIDLVRRRDFDGAPNGSAGVFLNNGAGWVLKSGWNVPVPFADRIHAMNYDPGGRLVDLNGDGLADLVRAYRRNGVFSQAVYFGKGASDGTTNMTNVWAPVTDPEWAFPEAIVSIDNTATTTVSTDQGIRFADINGDGRVDIVRGYNQEQSNGSAVYFKKVHLRRGGKGWAEDATWSSRVPYTFVRKVYGGEDYDEGTRIADLDGNGTADFVRSMNDWDCARTLWQHRALNRDGFSDLMESSANGIGGTTTLTYRPSTAYDNRSPGAAAGAPSNLGHVVPVLESLTIGDGQSGPGHVYTTSYSYRGGLYHYGRREYRGFAYARANAPGGEAYTEMLFLQDPARDIVPLLGAPLRTAVRRTAAPGDTTGAGPVFSMTANDYDLQDGTPPSYFHWLRAITTHLYEWRVNAPIDSLGTTGSVKTTAAEYQRQRDAGGFVTRLISRAAGDPSNATDDLYEVVDYINDVGNWRIGATMRRFVTNLAPDPEGLAPCHPNVGPACLGEIWTYYDNMTLGALGAHGEVTAVERWSGDLADGPGSPGNRVKVMVYDEDLGHLVSALDEGGHPVYFDYGITDPTMTFVDRTRSVTASGGTSITHSVASVRDPRFGVPLSVTRTGSGSEAFHYDGFGRLIKRWTLFDSSALPTTCYAYTLTPGAVSIARFDRETSGVGEECGHAAGMIASVAYYDGMGRQVQQKYEDGNNPSGSIVSAVEFDAQGRLLAATQPFAAPEPVTGKSQVPASVLRTTYDYDEAGRPISVTAPGIPTATTQYAGWTRIYHDPEGKRTEADSDAYGRVIQRRTYTDTGTLYSTNTLRYDTLGRLRFLIDSYDRQIEYRYNIFGELVMTLDPDSGQSERRYNEDGLVREAIGADGRRTTHTYDALHRPLTESRSDGTEVIYRYDESSPQFDATGHLTSLGDSATGVEQSFEYDAMGRPIRAGERVGGVWRFVGRQLDSGGRERVLTYPDGATIEYRYASDGRINEVVGFASEIRYNPNGSVAHLRHANGVAVDYSYEPDTLRLHTMRAIKGSGTVLLDTLFGHSPSGYVSTIDTAGEPSQSFVLDHLYRLTSATGAYGTLSFEHDVAGNLRRKGDLVFNYEDPVHPHQATSLSTGESLGYDARGHLESVLDPEGNGRIFEYDHGGRLARVQDTSNDTEVLNQFNPQGHRVRRTTSGGAGTQETIFVGQLFESTGSASTRYVYLGSRRIAEWRSDGSKYHYVDDHLGSLSLVTDGGGTVVKRLRYTPYGETVGAETGGFKAAFKFAGVRFDEEAGLYDFGARFYDPVLGRFLSPDPILQDATNPIDLNPYGYARGNPVSLVDIGGHGTAWPAIAGLIVGIAVGAATGCGPCGGAAGGAVSGALAAHEAGGDVGQAALTGAVIGAISGAIGDAIGGAITSQMIASEALRAAVVGFTTGVIAGTLTAVMTGGDAKSVLLGAVLAAGISAALSALPDATTLDSSPPGGEQSSALEMAGYRVIAGHSEAPAVEQIRVRIKVTARALTVALQSLEARIAAGVAAGAGFVRDLGNLRYLDANDWADLARQAPSLSLQGGLAFVDGVLPGWDPIADAGFYNPEEHGLWMSQIVGEVTLTAEVTIVGVRVLGPFNPRTLPGPLKPLARIREFIRFDRPHHGKGWHFDGKIVKAVKEFFRSGT